MSTEQSIVALCNVFKKLHTSDKKIIAGLIFFHDTLVWHHKTRFLAAAVDSGLRDDKERALTISSCEKQIKNLLALGFGKDDEKIVVHALLHHQLLPLLNEDELQWVFAIVDVFFPSTHPDFCEFYTHIQHDYGNGACIRARLLKTMYANDPYYFLAFSTNPTYCTKLLIHLMNLMVHGPLDTTWLASRHPIIRHVVCVARLSDYYCEHVQSMDTNNIRALLSEPLEREITHDILFYYSAIIHISCGKLDAAAACCARIRDEKSGLSWMVRATLALLHNEHDTAQALYDKALPALKRHHEGRSYYLDNILGVFHSLFLAYVDKKPAQIEANTKQYLKYLETYVALPVYRLYLPLSVMTSIEKGASLSQASILKQFKQYESRGTPSPLVCVLEHLTLYMNKKSYVKKNQTELRACAHTYLEQGHVLAAHLIYELLGQQGDYVDEAEAFLETSAIKLRFLELIQVKDEWEYTFQALESILVEGAPATQTYDKRLLWLVNPDKAEVSVVEQRMTKAGRWSAGRAVNLNKLKHYQTEDGFEHITSEDERVIACIINEGSDWHEQYELDQTRALLVLVGHSQVAHHHNRELMIELLAVEPELCIDEKKNKYHLSLSHWRSDAGLLIEPVSMHQYRVIDFSPTFAKIGKILTKKGLSVPADAKDKILHVIQHAKRDIQIHVGMKDIDVPEIAGDPTPCVQILPLKECIRLALWVRPSLSYGVCFNAAEGREHVMTLVHENGEDVRARIARDFVSEKRHQSALLNACPMLMQYETEPGVYETEGPEATLEVLSELQHYATEHPVTIEWPQGQTFKIKQRLLPGSMSMKISSQNNWFEYGGEIKLDEGDVLSMDELLEALSTQTHGRFVRLADGEFLELTHALRKQLSILNTLSDGNKINAFGAQVLSELVNEAESATFDEGWKAHVKKMQAMKQHHPVVPSTLQASLRDYQVDGFHYLSKLTNWGIGACLADDMGLGKTVQTIALLLEHAKSGATLIIAPTSVCFNWLDELKKFAPTLNVYNLHTDQREHAVEQASAFDVIICSYGLLQRNSTLLTDKAWETLVLDEAQAIKNAHTQRWKSVMKLKATHRVALSGTPIENHLGELWSIFSFLNPGLLGSLKSFQNKYISPIESGHGSHQMQALRALVSPYILRRIKSDVLRELPAKTEQVIYIEPSAEERSFYEALRRSAEKSVAELMEGNNRIAVLAEITKLRQACCDSSLVNPSITLENSKLNILIETVKNLIDNGHKALVFSQYVSFLKLVKARLNTENISYQYLDGATSPAHRKKAVTAFQNGESDLFLLSLKAGGSGLNLTAADYVIHLDPWWNPAVEDQASDRAHRIGQERPVTIYRLIMQNTIEQKILELHQHKRNLANELLSGQGVSGKLSNDDLMQLIHHTAEIV